MLRQIYLILVLSLCYSIGIAQNMEICDNAIDDDNDGLIDFQDDDCECEFIEIRSLIPNPSFEQMSCCPDQHYRLDCAAPWIQAYGVTPDYIHTCGWMGPDNIGPPLPFPDGGGIIGFANGQVRGNLPIEYNWKEYAMACLLEPMIAGTSYRIEFSLGFSSQLASPPLELTIYGTSNCDNIPFGINESMPGCPTNYPEWVNLEGKLISNDIETPNWVDDYFEFTPATEIRAIAIGADCEPFPGERTEYYFLDNLIMEETYLFQYQIEESGNPCLDDFTLSVNTTATLAYQWYKDSIALVGETNPELLVNYGSGNYQVRMIEEDGCRMSPPYLFIKPEQKDTTLLINICKGETYTNGNFNTDQAGDYQIVLTTREGCDSLINLNIEYCDLYIPNAFSPNDDGLNDTFKVFSRETHDNYTLYIYNRWGALVYEGQEWDGYIKGQQAPDGVYIYFVNFDDSNRVAKKGAVTLIR